MLMTNPVDIERFIFAGNAKFTLVSKKTENRFTFRVKKSEDGKLYFVSLLSGVDNISHYTYMGIIVTSDTHHIRLTQKSKVGFDAPAFKAFSWYLYNIGDDKAEFYHCGKCCKCGRTLTVPESIVLGIGPVCMGKL